MTINIYCYMFALAFLSEATQVRGYTTSRGVVEESANASISLRYDRFGLYENVPMNRIEFQ